MIPLVTGFPAAFVAAFFAGSLLIETLFSLDGIGLMGVMMLAAGKGSKVVIEIEGPDESDAMDAIVSLIGDYFGEGQ